MKSLTKKQRDVLEFMRAFNRDQGYAPSIKEIGDHFGWSSPATVHQHLKALAAKGYIEREWNRKRDIVFLDDEASEDAAQVPLLGMIAAGAPIEAVLEGESVDVPSDLLRGKGRFYALRVSGNSMMDDHVLDGDLIVVRAGDNAENGQTVVALVEDEGATLKRYYREGAQIRLQPANEVMEPIYVNEEQLRVQGVLVGLVRGY